MKWLLLILLSGIWGSSYMLMKHSLKGFDYVEVGLARSAIAGLVLLPFAIYYFSEIQRRHLKPLLWSVLLSTFIPNLLFAKAQVHISGGLTGILNAFSPLFVIMTGALIFKRKVHLYEWYGVLLGMVGCVLMLYFSKGIGEGNPAYGLMVLLAALMGSLNVQIIHHYLNDVKPLALASVTLGAGSIFSLVLLWTGTEFWQHLQQPSGQQAFWYVMVLAVLSSAVALVLFNYLLSLSNPIFSSNITYLMPVVAVLWGIRHNEPFGWAYGVGMLLIFLGIYITNAQRAGDFLRGGLWWRRARVVWYRGIYLRMRRWVGLKGLF